MSAVRPGGDETETLRASPPTPGGRSGSSGSTSSSGSTAMTEDAPAAAIGRAPSPSLGLLSVRSQPASVFLAGDQPLSSAASAPGESLRGRRTRSASGARHLFMGTLKRPASLFRKSQRKSVDGLSRTSTSSTELDELLGHDRAAHLTAQQQQQLLQLQRRAEEAAALREALLAMQQQARIAGAQHAAASAAASEAAAAALETAAAARAETSALRQELRARAASAAVAMLVCAAAVLAARQRELLDGDALAVSAALASVAALVLLLLLRPSAAVAVAATTAISPPRAKHVPERHAHIVLPDAAAARADAADAADDDVTVAARSTSSSSAAAAAAAAAATGPLPVDGNEYGLSEEHYLNYFAGLQVPVERVSAYQSMDDEQRAAFHAFLRDVRERFPDCAAPEPPQTPAAQTPAAQAQQQTQQQQQAPLPDDVTVLRFLQADKYNAAVAGRRLLETLAWRRRIDMARVTAAPPAHLGVYRALRVRRCMGRCHKGRPVFAERIGEFINGLGSSSARAVSHADLVACNIYEMGHYVAEFRAAARDAGVAQWKMIFVADLKGVRVYSALRAVGVLKLFAKEVEVHFPEQAGPIFLINVPAVVNTAWKMVRQFLDPSVLAKIQIHPGVPTEAMLKVMDRSVLFKEYGGDNDADYPHVTL